MNYIGYYGYKIRMKITGIIDRQTRLQYNTKESIKCISKNGDGYYEDIIT